MQADKSENTRGETPDCDIKDDNDVMDGILVFGESQGHAGVSSSTWAFWDLT